MNLQYNAITRAYYNGRNQALLLTAKEVNGFQSDAWMTFLQAKSIGHTITKGSKGSHIFKGFEKFQETAKDKNGKEYSREVSRPLGGAVVFNLDQTTALESVPATESISTLALI